MRRWTVVPGTVTAMLVVVLLAVGCSQPVDRSVHPQPARSYAPERHPFQGATLLVDPDTAAARWQAANGAAWLDPLTSRPQARWLNTPQDVAALGPLLEQARATHTLPVLVTYHIPDRGCGGFKEGAPNAAAYDAWIGSLVDKLRGTRAAIVMEPDAVAAECFTPERAALLRRSVIRLAAAGQSVYLDAGHSAWRSSGDMAPRLLAAGIQSAEGFAVNVSNRRGVDESYRWGRELSDLVGGRDFVIDTSRDGAGPPDGPPGDRSTWCNPAHQALGQAPTVRTGRPGLAALLWIKAPGESDGPCGGEHGYAFSPAQARTLIAGAPWLPPSARRAAEAVHPSAGN